MKPCVHFGAMVGSSVSQSGTLRALSQITTIQEGCVWIVNEPGVNLLMGLEH